MVRSSVCAIRPQQSNRSMIGILLAMPLCWTAVRGFSAGGAVRSALPRPRPAPQTRKFGSAAAASIRPDPTAETTSSSPSAMPKSSKRTDEENDQMEEEAVDEYLEFLDRRYRRLHEKESSSSKKYVAASSFSSSSYPTIIKTPFSVLNWLKQPSQESLTDAIITEQIQEDALYVLGVAGLASKRLLHKHHIPESFLTHDVPSRSSRIMAREGAIDVSSTSSSTTIAGIDAVGVLSPFRSNAVQEKAVVALAEMEKIIARAMEVRRAVIAYQTRKLIESAKVALKTLATLIKNAWSLGGGKRSLAIAVTLASILTIALIRPLLISVGKASVNIVKST